MKMAKGIRYCLTKAGYLVYRRQGMWKTIRCVKNEDRRCGDWCPFFGEPVSVYRNKEKWVKLKLCYHTMMYKKKYFRDYRNLECGPFSDTD